MSKKSIGARSVGDTAAKMGVNKSYITNTTRKVLRKLRWPNRLKAVRKFINEYSKTPS